MKVKEKTTRFYKYLNKNICLYSKEGWAISLPCIFHDELHMGLKVVLAFGQTVTDTDFSQCFKQCIVVYISLILLYKLS